MLEKSLFLGSKHCACPACNDAQGSSPLQQNEGRLWSFELHFVSSYKVSVKHGLGLDSLYASVWDKDDQVVRASLESWPQEPHLPFI